MIRLLPFILIPILIVGGLGYWRYMVSKQSLTTPQTNQQDQDPQEVPKSLPNASLEDRVNSLEETVTKLISQVNSLKSSSPAQSTLDAQVTELKARVSSLEKATPQPQTSSKSTVYIPLGSGGGPWANIDWYSMPEYEISLDPGNYPGFTGMVLEVTFRMVEAAGTGSVRLYNMTDSSATSNQLDTTSTTFSLKTSSSFKIPSGSKTYRLQVKSSQNKDIFIQSARIKVNF